MGVTFENCIFMFAIVYLEAKYKYFFPCGEKLGSKLSKLLSSTSMMCGKSGRRLWDKNCKTYNIRSVVR